MNEKKYTSIGGQAVIEGVMMRSPHFLTIAIRKPDQKIIVKEQRWKGLGDRFPLLKKPFLRGIGTLLESMINGIEALSYSANAAVVHSPDNKKSDAPNGKAEELSSFAIFSSIFFAFAMGMGLFVAAPHYLTAIIGDYFKVFDQGVANPLFHLIDGGIKVFFLVSYIFIIGQMKDIYRVFQYHGAEHKSIAAFENGDELIVENARKYSTLHPRCGTSFMLFLLVISILIFSGLFPLIGARHMSTNVILNHSYLVLMKIVLMFPVAGISYEFIKWSASHMGNPVCKGLIYPGLLLQKLTTREPTDEQLEVALCSIKRVLFLEKNPTYLSEKELELHSVSEIANVSATLSEFPS